MPWSCVTVPLRYGVPTKLEESSDQRDGGVAALADRGPPRAFEPPDLRRQQLHFLPLAEQTRQQLLGHWLAIPLQHSIQARAKSRGDLESHTHGCKQARNPIRHAGAILLQGE